MSHAGAPRYGVAGAMGVCAALVWFASASINVPLSQIGADLDASANGLQWSVNAYLLALAGMLVVGGRAGDLFGRRRMLLIGLGGFAFASVLAGLAPSLPLFVAARALMGVAGGLLLPQTLSLIAQEYPQARRGRAIGIWAMIAAVGQGGAAPLGGFVADLIDWRAVLFADVPIAALAAGAVLLARVPERERHRGVRLDVPSALLFAGAAVALVAALTELDGGRLLDAEVLAPLVAAALLAAGFVAVSRRSAQPLFDLALLRRGRFVGAVAINLFVNAALMAILFLGPIYLQRGLGLSTGAASAATLGAMIAMVAAALPAGWAADRGRPRRVLAAGLGLTGTGALLLALAGDGGTATTLAVIAFALAAAGQCLAIVPASAIALASVGPREAGAAAGILKTTSMLGSVLGVAVSAAVYDAVGAERLRSLFAGHGAPLGDAALAKLTNLLAGGHAPGALDGLPGFADGLVSQATVGAFTFTMAATAVACALLTAAVALARNGRGAGAPRPALQPLASAADEP
jgi:MFS family permease